MCDRTETLITAADADRLRRMASMRCNGSWLPAFPGFLTLRLAETPKERERSRRKPATHWGRFFETLDRESIDRRMTHWVRAGGELLPNPDYS
jgi:hypothetical protein